MGFIETKEKLDSVGCGFCIAKWTQVTMHLHNGMTHSCHHPAPHKVSVSEIQRNPTALHNSSVKKQARKEMMEGKRPKECDYCWKIEDNSNSFSDRVFKSSEPWSEPYFEEIKNSYWREDYTPKYVEISFSNVCNFKCAYCGPVYSSKWMEEINKFGGYKLPSHEYNGMNEMLINKTIPYKHSDPNPYVDAFWEWWSKLYYSLDTFRITGGEPLLSKDFWRILDDIANRENPNKNLKLSINTNLGVDDQLIDKLIEKVKSITEGDRVKECIIYTSCDAFGEQAEYVRYGMNFNKLMSNIEKILSNVERVSIVIMSTFNIFSIFSYQSLVKKVHELKLNYFSTNRYWNAAVILDTSYLRHPEFLSFRLLSGYVDVDKFLNIEKYMAFNSSYRSLNFFQPQTKQDVGFSLKEIEKIGRIKDYFNKGVEKTDHYYTTLKDFNGFIEEYEKRRGIKCLDYFPELTDFINDIHKL
jgi:organic radical activating enzyme